jgi:hypothetical protein
MYIYICMYVCVCVCVCVCVRVCVHTDTQIYICTDRGREKAINNRESSAFSGFYQGSSKALLRLYEGSSKSLLRLYEGSIKALLRLSTSGPLPKTVISLRNAEIIRIPDGDWLLW